MNRSFADFVKDAGDLARRTNLQILLLAGGLVLAWLSGIEGQYRKISLSIASLSEIRVSKDYWDEIKSRTSQRQMAYRRSYPRDVQLYRSRCSDNRQTEECLTLDSRIRSATAYPQKAERVFDESRRIEARQREERQRLTTELARQINFDFGYGVKLPFNFSLAPIIWLLLMSSVLVRVMWQRSKFWSLLAKGLKCLPRNDRRLADLQLTDMPLWLAPVPKAAREGVRKPQLARMVGWSTGSPLGVFSIMLFVLVLIAVLRVGWIGSVVSGIGAHASIPYSHLIGYLTAAAFAVSLAILGALVIPWWTSAARNRPEFGRRDRRLLLAGGLSAAILFVVQSSTSGAFALRWWSARRNARARATRFRPRLARVSTVEGPIMEPGWYRHTRTGVIHYIWAENRVRRARGLRARNLAPLNVRLSAMPADSAKIEPWIRTRDFPLVIAAHSDRLLQQRKIAEAIKLLVLASPYRWTLVGPSAALPWMDRAARLSASHGVTIMLARLIDTARQLESVQPNRGPSVLGDRIARWEVWLSRLASVGERR